MELESLLTTTGDTNLDDIVLGGIGVIESAFPGRIRGYYLVGSHYRGDAVPDSDVDVIIVPKSRFSADDIDRFRRLKISCSLRSPVRLDFQICNADLDDTSTHLLKYHSLALFGEDTRHGMPDVLPPDAIALMQDFVGSLKVIRAIDSWPDKLTYPLTYPDPDGEFFGYDINGIRLNDYPLDDYIPGTRTLIRNLISGAELLVRMRVDCHLVSRQHAIRSYDEHVGDEWALILKEAVERCRSTWLYQIPQRKGDRSYLRQLCQKTLSFENRIVHDCRLHLQKLLRSDSEVKLLHAIRATAESVLADKQARSALNVLVEDTRSEIRRAAMESLSQLEDQ